MNVIGSRPDGWWKDRRGATIRLVNRLERWAAAGGHQVTVVLESGVIRIAEAPASAANSADDEIVRLVRADPAPHDITVVTSDGALVERITAAGAATRPAGGFRSFIDEKPGEQP